MLFPFNAVQRGKFQGTACTLTATEPQTGLTICTNQFVTLLANNNQDNLRIYQITFSSPRALNYELFCNIGGTRTLIQAHLGSSQTIPTNVNCTGAIDYAYSGITTDSFASIVYATTTQENMSTTTNPFIETNYEGGTIVSQHYDPIKALVGIETIIITFAFVVLGFIHVFRKL